MAPYQRAVLERGIYHEWADPRSAEVVDPSLRAGMMYTGAVGVMLMEQMSTMVEGMEGLVQQTRTMVERR